ARETKATQEEAQKREWLWNDFGAGCNAFRLGEPDSAGRNPRQPASPTLGHGSSVESASSNGGLGDANESRWDTRTAQRNQREEKGKPMPAKGSESSGL